MKLMKDPQHKTVVILSGGLDSATLLYHLKDAGHELRALSVNYGQRHSRELKAAEAIARVAEVEHRVVDISGLAAILGENALTDQSVDVPHGEYQPATITVTTVPNRNMIMLSIAAGWALALKFNGVAFGAHAGEYTPYPDCQPQFAAAMNCVMHVCDDNPIEVLAPFVRWDKSGIVQRGIELQVPFDLTWSCYEGGELHCGQCSTCLDRRKAFTTCGIDDPVEYAP